MTRNCTTIWLGIAVLLSSTAGHCDAGQTATIRYDKDNPMHVFGVQDLKKALEAAGNSIVTTDAQVQIDITAFRNGMGPQSFRIQKVGTRGIRIVAGDSVGAMYGVLELAEQITLGGGLEAVEEKARKPYILRRGLKFNIPLDARAPSYDDTGSSAHHNIPVMWQWEFWKQFLDTMVRNRYNVLTLWTTHPYPGMVQLPKYPEANYDDVCVLKHPVDETGDRHWDKLDVFDPANTVVVKKISLNEKIAFWQRVFSYAEDHGIEIHVFHWNIYTFGGEGKYGITDEGENERTVEYVRYCVHEFLKTYPQIDGIGVAAGEHFDIPRPERARWLRRTYGQAVMDYVADHPDRQITFIFRQLMADLANVTKAFADYDAGPLHTDHKYARARVHSSTTSPYLDIEYRDSLEACKTPCWLNLRNDDLFVLRWGNPEYVREFMANVPRDVMRHEAGYFLGPDGFVQGREFVHKDPDLSGQLEVDKHWYRFMMFGRLGYDLTLTREFFEARLKQRFAQVDAPLLYKTWRSASEIVPLVNRFFFRVNDVMFSPEGCIDNRGFLTADESFFRHGPLAGSGILSVKQYAGAVVANQSPDGITPLEVADSLDEFADKTLRGVRQLRRQADNECKELLSTLADLEAMAHLGRYYADKIRGAAHLAVFRADPNRRDEHRMAVSCFEQAVSVWEVYAQVATQQYRPQLFSRTHYMDWWKILDEVKKEARSVAEEGR